MTLYKFQSYSGDDFLMLSKNDKIKTAEEFCKKYVSYEYEGWGPGEFQYNSFQKQKIKDTDDTIRVNLHFGEYETFAKSDFELDEAYFSDEYQHFDSYKFHSSSDDEEYIF